MKQFFITVILAIFGQVACAQEKNDFKGYLFNKEYLVYLRINFHDKDVVARGQEIFGKLPGYLGSKRDSRLWLITDVNLKKGKEAHLSIINDYGSEDLEAVLEKKNDSTYTLKQLGGSAIKIVVDRKWVKLPKVMTFKLNDK